MRPIRYIGRHRNAGYGYSVVQRVRREVAYWLRDHGRVRLGYLVDFNRDRYAEDDHDPARPPERPLAARRGPPGGSRR